MRLARLELKDVGPFEDAVFEIPEPKGPGELVLFEGPNGSGKTTIVQAIACALDVGPRAGTNIQGSPWKEFSRRCRNESTLAFDSDERGGLSVLSVTESTPQQGWTNHASAQLLQTSVHLANSTKGSASWAAFAYRGHQPTPMVQTRGPADIAAPPMLGALSFGAHGPASAYFGQLLTNIEFDRIKAALYAQETAPSEKRDEMARIAHERRESLRRFETVFSRVLDRVFRIEFPFGKHSPGIAIDGEQVPLDLLGEGMRSTISWLADLMVRLERIPWSDTSRSPLEQEFWLILDEIDESLHPTMQARVLPAVRELFPNARIYATTHSPFVVASIGEGTIFAIRPDKDHKVRGQVEARALERGQSLELVTTDIFQAPSGFVDQWTRDALDVHKRDVRRFQRTGSIDWDAFLARRAELMKLNDEVRTVVAMQEVPIRTEIDRRMLAREESRELGTGT
ncbi:MAG: AAA family ATPase [Minicystis sp.]